MPALVFDSGLRSRVLMSCRASSQKRERWDSSCSCCGPTRISIGYVDRAARLPRRVRASHWSRTCFHGPAIAYNELDKLEYTDTHTLFCLLDSAL